MRMRQIMSMAVLAGIYSSTAIADPIPLADLKGSGKAGTALGDWSVAGFGGRDDFPYLADRKELEMIEPGRFSLPSRNAGEIKIDDKNVHFRSAGRQNNADTDKWLGAVVFSAKDAGTFSVAGKLTGLWCDSNKSSKTSVKWAVLKGKADGVKFKVVATGDAGDGDSVDLASAAELKSVALEKGETIVVTLFRPGQWGAAGGNLAELTIDPATTTTTPEPPK